MLKRLATTRFPSLLAVPAHGSRSVCTQGSKVPQWRLRNKKIVGKSTGVYGSKLQVDTVRDLPGGYMLTGRRGSESEKPGGRQKEVFLVTGACGQVGSELITHLRKMHGRENVIATDVRSATPAMMAEGPFHYLDVTQHDQLARLVIGEGVNTIVHLAALLSATGELNPKLALQVNLAGVHNVLEIALANKLKVFSPSTIAVFGPTTPRDLTPDDTNMRPTTIYGVTKVHLELLGEYYHNKYGLDFRSLRYPGVISSAAKPGGGTTDYAVEIYHEALQRRAYKCFLDEDTRLPMVYMPDLLRGTTDLMNAPEENLTQRTYNLNGMSFTPREQAESIRRHIPDFEMEYAPDFRQEIAATWPMRLDDSIARADWGWAPRYSLDDMTSEMLAALGEGK